MHTKCGHPPGNWLARVFSGLNGKTDDKDEGIMSDIFLTDEGILSMPLQWLKTQVYTQHSCVHIK